MLCLYIKLLCVYKNPLLDLPCVIVVVILFHYFSERSSTVQGKDPGAKLHQARPHTEVVCISQRLPAILEH